MQYEKHFIESEKKALEHDLPDKYYYSGYCWYFGFGRNPDKEKAQLFYEEGCKKRVTNVYIAWV